jgi:DNA polymerase III delta prime subunit
MMDRIENSVFVRKYQPTSLNDVIGSFVPRIQEYIKDPMAMPNFLFASRTPGSGKTTLGKVIIKELGCESLILNSSKDRSIDTVRNTIGEFIKYKSRITDRKKCVFLDECDGLTKDAQNSLRAMMETYMDNVFFILTCNYITKVTEPIRSRCIEIDFMHQDKKQIYCHLHKICEAEQIQYSPEGLKQVILGHYPSIRDMVLYLQDVKVAGGGLSEDAILKKETEYDFLWNIIVTRDILTARRLVMDGTIDVIRANQWIFDKLFELGKRSVLTADQVKQMCFILADNERDFAVGCDIKIIFIASIYKMTDIVYGIQNG